MPLASTADETTDLLASLSRVEHLVFDLNSLPDPLSGDELEIFRQMLDVLTDRDFTITLIVDDQSLTSDWPTHKTTVITIPKEETGLLFQNPSLFTPEAFWITENPQIQQHLAKQQQVFAYGSTASKALPGVHYEYLQDLLELFNPSHQAALMLSETILNLKSQAPQQPLIVGVGGPEECGHAFFIEMLIEVLEGSPYLIEGVDLTELLSTEFHVNGYWRSSAIQSWMMNELLLPFAEGDRICIETPPAVMEAYETNVYPLFLAPEMILVVWGNTLFLPQLQDIIDWSILLELSPKVATARLFGIDEHENFDPDFIRKYEENDGRLYQHYLQQYQVEAWVEQKVDFNNFRAFRLKS